MSLYDELYETVSKAVWTGLKNDQEPPTQDALYNIIAAQLMLNLSTYPRYKELKGTFDEEAFIETLAKDYWSKKCSQANRRKLSFLFRKQRALAS